MAVFVDDILSYGTSMEQHDARLEKVLQCVELAGLRTQQGKMLPQTEPAMLPGSSRRPVRGQTGPWQSGGQSPAATAWKCAGSKKRVMMNYLGRFVPALATVEQPLYELLKSKNIWTSQQLAFEDIKRMLTKAPILTFYDVTRPTAVSTDTSSYGLGDVLLQLDGEEWKPVAYCCPVDKHWGVNHMAFGGIRETEGQFFFEKINK